MAEIHPSQIEKLISKLSLDNKVSLLSGAGRCAFASNGELGIPTINVRQLSFGTLEGILLTTHRPLMARTVYEGTISLTRFVPQVVRPDAGLIRVIDKKCAISICCWHGGNI
jgi:hypothetical protein